MNWCNLSSRSSVFYILVFLVLGIALLYIFQDCIQYTKNIFPIVRVEMANQTGLAPCGEVCSYSGVPHPRSSYPFIKKQIDCPNIMKRMAWTGHKILNPPPKQPAAHQLKDFTQNGECPLGKPFYLNGVQASGITAKGFNEKDIKQYIANDKAGISNSMYKEGIVVSQAVRKYKKYVNGMKGYVVGTEKPWVEAALLANGATHVTTIEYRDFLLKYPNISLVNPYKFAEMYVHGKIELFDFGASFSSLEHSGLGRYGDPQNPFGDFEAMAQAYCITKPGGYYFLGVPGIRKCEIIWNAHRIYSNARLQYLTANWEVVDIFNAHGPAHVLIVLRKPDV